MNAFVPVGLLLIGLLIVATAMRVDRRTRPRCTTPDHVREMRAVGSLVALAIVATEDQPGYEEVPSGGLTGLRWRVPDGQWHRIGPDEDDHQDARHDD